MKGTPASASPQKTLQESQYYLQLQQRVRAREEEQRTRTEVQRQDQLRSQVEVKKQTETVQKTPNAAEMDFPSRWMRFAQDQVEIQNFRWERDSRGEFELKPNEKPPIITNVDLKVAQKIDISSRLQNLKESYMHNMVQSRSSNFFLSRYAQFKMGFLGQLLTSLGVGNAELGQLQRKALDGAIQENVDMMAENIYNQEVAELVYGKNRKMRRTMAMFREIQMQLLKQMNLLGKEGYWTKARLLEEKIRQCKKIEEEFLKERDALKYQFDVLMSEG
jgi:hypothetical protein